MCFKPKGEFLIDWQPDDIDRLFVYEHAPVSAEFQYNASPSAQLADKYGVDDLAKQFGSSDPWLKWGAWMARRHETEWSINLTPFHDYTQTTTIRIVKNTIKMLCGLRVKSKVFWSAQDGFHPRAGTAGLTYAKAEYVLRRGEEIRWIVLGTPTSYGQFVFMFDNFTLDSNYNPHPMGMWLLV